MPCFQELGILEANNEAFGRTVFVCRRAFAREGRILLHCKSIALVCRRQSFVFQAMLYFYIHSYSFLDDSCSSMSFLGPDYSEQSSNETVMHTDPF